MANLYQLLSPTADRKPFYLGNREFDPKHVGFVIDKFDGGFEFNSQDADGKAIPGNSNAGHEGENYTGIRGEDGEFHQFTEDERWELVEFLKTLH